MISALALVIFRDWQSHKLRLALTTAGIALGVAVFFAIQTANETLVDSLNGTIEKLAGKSTLQIVAAESGFSQNVLKLVRNTPGVQFAEPVTETVATTTLGTGERVLVLGLDTSSDLALYDDSFDQKGLVIDNPLAFSNRTDSVAVTRKFADRYQLKNGDQFTVNAQTGTPRLTVRGIFSASGIVDVYDGNVTVMDIASAQKLFGRGDKIDRIDVSNKPDITVDELQKLLAARLPEGIEAVRPNLRGQSLENSVTSMHIGFTIMSVLAMTIGIFLIYNSFSISLNQRWKEIAVLRAIGVESGNVRRMFLAESVFLGLVGSAAGVGAGFLLAKAAMKILLGVSVVVYGFVTSADSLRFDWWFALDAFLLGVVASLIAAWLPARAASNIDPALALRNIETREPAKQAGRFRIVAGLAFIALGLLLIRFTPPAVGSYIQMSYSLALQIGMILLLPVILVIGGRILRPVMNLLFGIEGVIAVESMARSPRRTVATVGAIMIGLAFVFSAASLIKSQKSALNRMIDKAVEADILVMSSEQLHSRTYHLTQETAANITSLPEVARADAFRVTTTDYDGTEITLLAHDMNAYFDISPDLLDRGDTAAAREATTKGEGVLVSNNFAFHWNIKLGDTLTVRSPRGDLHLAVVGMLEYYRSLNGTIFLDRELYKRYWDDTDVDYIYIDLNPSVDRAVFKDKVQAAIAGTQQAFIYTHEEYKSWVTRLIDQFFTMMYIQMVVAILVAAIGLLNTMLISVSERKRELGIFRAIGGLRRQVIKMVLLEAVAISLIGLATGVITGVMNSYFLINTAAKLVAGFDLRMQQSYTVIVAAVPLVFFIAIISAWLPARKASRLEIVEAIGYE